MFCTESVRDPCSIRKGTKDRALLLVCRQAGVQQRCWAGNRMRGLGLYDPLTSSHGPTHGPRTYLIVLSETLIVLFLQSIFQSHREHFSAYVL